jgi:hypothetical protein
VRVESKGSRRVNRPRKWNRKQLPLKLGVFLLLVHACAIVTACQSSNRAGRPSPSSPGGKEFDPGSVLVYVSSVRPNISIKQFGTWHVIANFEFEGFREFAIAGAVQMPPMLNNTARGWVEIVDANGNQVLLAGTLQERGVDALLQWGVIPHSINRLAVGGVRVTQPIGIPLAQPLQGGEYKIRLNPSQFRSAVIRGPENRPVHLIADENWHRFTKVEVESSPADQN